MRKIMTKIVTDLIGEQEVGYEEVWTFFPSWRPSWSWLGFEGWSCSEVRVPSYAA